MLTRSRGGWWIYLDEGLGSRDEVCESGDVVANLQLGRGSQQESGVQAREDVAEADLLPFKLGIPRPWR
jgi:hypothetical protein